MKKFFSVLLSLTLIISAVSCLCVSAAADSSAHQAVLYVYGDINDYGPNDALFLTAGAEFYARQEIDGEPFEPPVLPAGYVTVDTEPSVPGPVLPGQSEGRFFRCKVSESIPTEMAMTGGFGFERDGEDGKQIEFCDACVYVFSEHKDVYAVTPDSTVYDDGSTVLLLPGEEIKLCFELTGGPFISSGAWSPDPTQLLVSGWFSEALTNAGFSVPFDPVSIDDKYYVSVTAEGLKYGDSGVLPVWFVQARHVFGDNAIGWENASAVYRGMFRFLVVATKDLIPGDVDMNGKVEAGDARLALRQAVELESFKTGTPEYDACDADLSGSVTAEDARLILRASVGLEDLYEIRENVKKAA